MPRLGIGNILRGWTLNAEYISEILRSLRFRPEYAAIFEDLVSYDLSSDLQDLKAVKKTATAYAKLLFPHVMDINQLDDEAIMRYKEEYAKYCLIPAIEKRQIIREQCHHLDKEYKREMPVFSI